MKYILTTCLLVLLNILVSSDCLADYSFGQQDKILEFVLLKEAWPTLKHVPVELDDDKYQIIKRVVPYWVPELNTIGYVAVIDCGNSGQFLVKIRGGAVHSSLFQIERLGPSVKIRLYDFKAESDMPDMLPLNYYKNMTKSLKRIYKGATKVGCPDFEK